MEYQESETYPLNKKYNEINQHMNIIYRFITRGYESLKKRVDYGCGPSIGMIEVHTLSAIAVYPGITPTEIRQLWGNNPTLSAVSQNISKLLKKGLIYQEKFENDDKRKRLYTTELGEALHRAHVQHDITAEENLMNYLKQNVTEEELEAFFKVTELLSQIILQDMWRASELQPPETKQ